MKIFSGEKSRYFAKQICEHLNVSLGNSKKQVFSDGEFVTHFNETLRGERVYLVQSTFQPLDNLMELLMMSDAAKRAGAKEIVAVIPYLGYSRSDKKDFPRVPIVSSMVAKMIEASGINHVVTLELHSSQIEGFYNIPVSHIYSHTSLIPFLRKSFIRDEVVFISPDMGSSKRTNKYSQFLKTDMAICYKSRERANEIKEIKLIGSVKGKHAIIIDDLIDTGGTICKCANMLMENGAKSVQAVITHPVLSGKAYENLGKSKLDKLIVTNSIPIKNRESIGDFSEDELNGYEKITIINVAPLFSSIIKNIENNSSISANFI